MAGVADVEQGEQTLAHRFKRRTGQHFDGGTAATAEAVALQGQNGDEVLLAGSPAPQGGQSVPRESVELHIEHDDAGQRGLSDLLHGFVGNPTNPPIVAARVSGGCEGIKSDASRVGVGTDVDVAQTGKLEGAERLATAERRLKVVRGGVKALANLLKVYGEPVAQVPDGVGEAKGCACSLDDLGQPLEVSRQLHDEAAENGFGVSRAFA